MEIQSQQYWVNLLLGIQMKTDAESIPVIDLFAGPGGLCEGFSSIFDEAGARRFDVKVSFEKDPVAHSTLMLRAIFRRFPKGKAPDAYYDYVRGSMSRAEFLSCCHDGLQWWSRQSCAGSRFMSSAARRRTADRKRWRGLPAYAAPELLITGVFS